MGQTQDVVLRILERKKSQYGYYSIKGVCSLLKKFILQYSTVQYILNEVPRKENTITIEIILFFYFYLSKTKCDGICI